MFAKRRMQSAKDLVIKPMTSMGNKRIAKTPVPLGTRFVKYLMGPLWIIPTTLKMMNTERAIAPVKLTLAEAPASPGINPKILMVKMKTKTVQK